MNTIDLTLPLSVMWLFALLVGLIMIISMPIKFRSYIRGLAKNKNSRLWIVFLCFTIGFIHLLWYNRILDGSDLALISIGWLALVKGMAFMFVPKAMLLLESEAISKSIVLWILIMGVFTIYFANNIYTMLL